MLRKPTKHRCSTHDQTLHEVLLNSWISYVCVCILYDYCYYYYYSFITRTYSHVWSVDEMYALCMFRGVVNKCRWYFVCVRVCLCWSVGNVRVCSSQARRSRYMLWKRVCLKVQIYHATFWPCEVRKVTFTSSTI